MNQNVPPGAAKLLDFLGRAETGKTGPEAYGVVVFHQQAKLPKPLTDYTIDELFQAQKLWASTGWSVKGKKMRGSAAGKYQIIRKTLLGLVVKLGIPGTSKFSPDMQDRLGFELLTQRGYAAFTSGQISTGAFALGLAKEWASMPVLSTTQGAHRTVKRGESYYAGDGVNASQKDASELEAILAQIGGKSSAEPVKPSPAPVTPRKPPILDAPDDLDIAVPPGPRPSNSAGWIVALAMAIAGALAGVGHYVWNWFGGLFS